MTESDLTYSRSDLAPNTVMYRSGRCPSGWKEYGHGTCFKFFNIVVPWAEAEVISYGLREIPMTILALVIIQ